MTSKYTLLLTACISPTAKAENMGSITHFRSDVQIRLQDYQTALQYWLNYTGADFNGIVVIENSGYDLSALQDLAANHNPRNLPVEFLQQKASPIAPGMHYGYSEAEMIDYAFDHSRLIQESEGFIKLTGRLYFPKLAKLLHVLPDNLKIAIDSRDFKVGKREQHYLVTTVFVIDKAFYGQYLYNAKATMVPHANGHIETAYYKILKPMYLNKQSGIILRLPFSMHPVGVGAHWNNNYSSGKNKLKTYFRDVARVILPDFWI